MVPTFRAGTERRPSAFGIVPRKAPPVISPYVSAPPKSLYTKELEEIEEIYSTGSLFWLALGSRPKKRETGGKQLLQDSHGIIFFFFFKTRAAVSVPVGLSVGTMTWGSPAANGLP